MMLSKKSSVICAALAILFWLIPFLIRLLFVEIPVISNESTMGEEDQTIAKIYGALDSNNNKVAFLLIFINNLQGCFINIIGGLFLGLGTICNLSFNGFMAADILINSFQSGFSFGNIIKTTLPHSFELLGFWISGAIGFAISWKLIQFMRGKEVFSLLFLRQVGLWVANVFVIILCAAYVEVYISINMLK